MSDISHTFGYVDTYIDGEHNKEPALAIFPKRLGANKPTYAIPLSSAYMYTDAKYLMQASYKCAEHLNFFPDRYIVNKIADTILNYLPDLVTQKPFIEAQSRKERGEGKVLMNNEEVARFGISDTNGLIL